MKRVPAVAVVGYKNTGKTTLVARLTEAFAKQGLRVGTCKHVGHDHLHMAEAGTDTEQHRRAGAAVTVAASPRQALLVAGYSQEPTLEHWLAQLSDPQYGLDLILVEGFKHSDLPKLVLLGPETPPPLTNVLAFVRKYSDQSIAERESNVYDRDDIQGLVQLIKCHILQG